MLFRKHRQKNAQLDERARKASEEAERSRERLHEIRRNVVQPLEQAGSRNQFAELIRQSLISQNGT